MLNSGDFGDIEARAIEARDGDESAMSEVISTYLPYWMGAARQIIARDGRGLSAGGAREEPGDLVQEAVAKLLSMWKAGEGPESNTRQYVATMMQNAYSNKMRSPRSRERALTDFESDVSVTQIDDVRAADLAQEMAAVRRALENLSQDHRDVLLGVLVEGLKPGDLTAHFARPAPAISNLLSRAKQSLMRLLLIDYLADGSDQCKANSQVLPKRVHLDFASHGANERGLAHVRICERCQNNWRRFAAISSAFGVLPLLTLAQVTSTPAPAAALASSTIPTPAVESGVGWQGKLSALATSKTTLSVGIGLLAVAGTIPLAQALLPAWEPKVHLPGTISVAADHDAVFDVHVIQGDDGRPTRVTAEFQVADTQEWEINRITLSLPAETTISSFPAGLDCQPGPTTTCTLLEDSTPGRVFEFGLDAAPHGTIDIDFDISAEDDPGNGRATVAW